MVTFEPISVLPRTAASGRRASAAAGSARRRCRRPAAATRTFTLPNSGSMPGIVVARVAAAALLALQRRLRDRLGDGRASTAGRSTGASRGCTAGGPRSRPSSARSWSSPISVSACFSSTSVRMMPTRFCIVSWSSWWIVYGFSPPSRSNGSSASAASRAISASSTAGAPVHALRVLGGAQPGAPAEHHAGRTASCRPGGSSRACRRPPRRPRTAPAPWRPASRDRRARRPSCSGTSGPISIALLGDVHVGQLLELVVHAGELLDDVGGSDSRLAMSSQTPPCGVPRPSFTSLLMARATSSRGSSSGVRRPLRLSAVPLARPPRRSRPSRPGTSRGCSGT